MIRYAMIGDAMTFSNLLTWCAQILLIAITATLVPRILQLSVPKARLAYWQLVLLACILLPFIQVRTHESIVLTGLSTATVALPVRTALPGPSTIPMSVWVLTAVAVGSLARLGWLLLGLFRMRQFRRNSFPLDPASSWSAEAELRVSDDIQSPVTFGFLRPVILLPRAFPGFDEATREAILCHEVMHVRRHDWLFTAAEELVRALLWFHPAIWWVLGEIQLAREQAVDGEVIGMTRSRDEYIDALLAIAGARPRADLLPVPLFLRKRHLKQRLFSILKEVHMSKTRSAFTLSASLILLAGSCWLITGAIPLYGAPQVAADAPGVAVEMNGSQLMHRNSVVYPVEAVVKKVEGTVTVQVKLDSRGNVVDAGILSGPDELRKAVLQSVLNWHFMKAEGNTSRTVSVRFELPKEATAGTSALPVPKTVMVRNGSFSAPLPPASPGPAPKFKSLSFPGTDQARSELMALLPMQVGDPITPEMASRTMQTVHEYDEHLRASFRQVSPDEMQLNIAAVPDAPSPVIAAADRPIRVGANVFQANLLRQPKPVYPPLAKEARVQGIVQFEATIGKDGLVESLHLLSGPPLLVQAAMEAVQQWVYKPTLLNGNPVSVITTIDVNFSLAQ